MLPAAPPPPADHYHHHPAARKPKRLELKTALKSRITARHCACVAATLLLQLIIILFLNRASPPPPLPSDVHLRRFDPPSPSAAADPGPCEHGLVYVYDLPSSLNHDLIADCADLDPWTSRCNAVSNGGFGRPATGLNTVVPPNLTPAWYWTDMYISEVIYHTRIKTYKCRTQNPADATAFYIPFYAGLAVGKYLWFNHTSADRDRHALQMLDWVKNQHPFKKSNGSDHFIMLGRLTWEFRRLTDDDTAWGTKFIYMPAMKNVLRLGVERSQWDPLEFSVPYPTAFHPRSKSDTRQWQNLILSKPRRSLFTFVGATRTKIRNDFRGVLMNYCKNISVPCKVLDCSSTLTECYDGAPAILQTFLSSDFCLQPKGDGYTRRSAFDCMLAGSIPVYFWRGSFEDQYEWHLPKQNESFRYSVFIDHNMVRKDSSIVEKVLRGFSRDEVRRMKETIVGFLPRMLYSRFDLAGGEPDAFEVTMEEVLKRFRRQKMSGNSYRLD